MSSPVQTRAHILTKATVATWSRGDLSAMRTADEQVRIVGADVVMSPRVARQLAYLLCEAADDAEDQNR